MYKKAIPTKNNSGHKPQLKKIAQNGYTPMNRILQLQKKIGNRGVQMLLANANQTIQRNGGSGGGPGVSFKTIWEASERANSLPMRHIRVFLMHVNRMRREMGIYDPRYRALEMAYHRFQRVYMDRQEARARMHTRILRQDQLIRKNIGIHTTRTTPRSKRRNLPPSLRPLGRGSGGMKSFFNYGIRGYGGAGTQGMHKQIPSHRGSVMGALSKIATDPSRQTTSSRGSKFTMTAIDPSRLQQQNLIDLDSPERRAEFMRMYGPGGTSKYDYSRKYNELASEGIVTHFGDIPQEMVMSLRAFRGEKSEEEMDEIMQKLLDAAADASFDVHPSRFDKFNGPPPPPPPSAGATAY